MNSVDVRRVSDSTELSREAARCLAESISSIAARKETVNLALCGGRTAGAVGTALSQIADLPWGRTHLFMVDERMVPLESADSNFRLINETLISNVSIPPENIHPFTFTGDPSLSADAYSKTIGVYGGRFDVVLLSAGEDGHVAALFPNHHSIESDAPLYLNLIDSPKPPPARATSSRTLLLASEAAVLVFAGESKRAALEMFVDESVAVEQCPAKLVRSLPQSFILTDLEHP